MTTINLSIQPSRENVAVLFEGLQTNKYFVDNSFQRRLVWTEAQKIRLIETILMGFPMPEIYLWEQKPDPESGAISTSIVDGQQRLTSIRQYIAGEFALKKSALDKANKTADYADCAWHDLGDSEKATIWSYRINTRIIPNDISIELIKAIFSRLNQTDKSLNPQELRNAKFNGEFIDASVQIADYINASEWNIFSDPDIRRMKDIEYGSQLLTYLILGITGHSSSILNDLYNNYNDKYPKKKVHVSRCKTLLDKIFTTFKDRELNRFFSKNIHFFTLFSVLDIMEFDDLNMLSEHLKKFIIEYENHDSDSPEANPLLSRYKKGASSGTATKSSRERRIYSLVDYLTELNGA